MNVERLETLKAYLENIPPEIVKKKKFDLNKWMTPSDVRDTEKAPFSVLKKIRSKDLHVVEPNYCQTTGCAMGWATTIPEFKEAGLILAAEPGDIYNACICYKHKNKWYEHFEAAENFFDIPYTTSRILFNPMYYRYDERNHPKFVIKRLKLLLKDGEEKLREKYAGW